MTNYILMIMLMISSMAINAMDVPNGRAAYLPMSDDEAFKLAIALSEAEAEKAKRSSAISSVGPLNEEQTLKMVLAMSQAEEQERQYREKMRKHIADKEMELAFALSKQTNAAAQPKQYDLTNPLEVIAWAQQEEGVTMTHDEAEAFAKEQRDQLELRQAIALSCELNDTLKTPEKLDTTPQAPAQVDSDSEKEADECFFCTEALDSNVVPVGPNCTHQTHSDCLAKIKEKFTKCPVCEANLSSKNAE